MLEGDEVVAVVTLDDDSKFVKGKPVAGLGRVTLGLFDLTDHAGIHRTFASYSDSTRSGRSDF